METKKPTSEIELKRWFSTGFMAGGVQSVDAEKHTLSGAVLIRPGEALGHGVWIDKVFCQAVAAMSAAGKSAQAGLKARFGHPNMCSDALGTFLGRWKGVTVDEYGFVRGDLHLSSTASESPNGDLRKYVEEMAAKEPDHFGASIVFSTDWEEFEKFYEANIIEVEEPDGKGGVKKAKRFQSPDPDNVKNLPHARLSELHAADLVDDPAATDGMFSGIGGAALASQMTEWLDTHPEVFKALQEPGMIDLVSRYGEEMKPFFERYQENAKKLGTIIQTTTTVWTDDKTEGVKEDATCPHCNKRFNYGSQPETSMGAVDCPHCGESCTQSCCDQKESTGAAEPAKTENSGSSAESDALGQVTILTAQVKEMSGTNAQLTVERDGAVKRAETAEESSKTLNAEREKHAERIAELEKELKKVSEDRDSYKLRFEAIESGNPPVSSNSAEKKENAGSGSLMERARKSKK